MIRKKGNFNMVNPFNGAPEFFIELHYKIDQLGHKRSCLDDTGFSLGRSQCGKWFVTSPISQAASKFLLARNVTGLNADGYKGEEPVDNYTGQLIFTLSAAAFETYCRLRDSPWFDVYRDIFTIDDGKRFRAKAQSQNLEANFYSRLIGAQKDCRLKSKIREFADGEDEKNFFAVCVGFRNAFAHGRLGSLSGTLALSHCAREIILQAIERDCAGRTDRVR